jgi:hypothetical protein
LDWVNNQIKLLLTAKKLNDLYSSFNDQYFQGQLPQATVAWEETAPGMVASTKRTAMGWSIWLNPIWFDTETQIRETLLHEMCHVEAKADEPSHGIDWQKSMMKLYYAGERWVLTDIANASVSDIKLQRKIGGVLKNARITKRLTIDELASCIGTEKKYITYLEAGYFSPFSVLLTADVLAKALGIEISTIMAPMFRE